MPAKRVLPITSALFFLIALSACSGPTDRDMILDLMTDLASRGEDRDAVGILAQLDEDYTDFEGRDKAQTENMLRGYFQRYRGIALNILGRELVELAPPEAEARMDVAFSSGAGKVFRKLAEISLDNYRLTLKFRKSDGAWKVHHAEWQPVSVGDLLSGPE
jgi:hypothetical protein